MRCAICLRVVSSTPKKVSTTKHNLLQTKEDVCSTLKAWFLWLNTCVRKRRARFFVSGASQQIRVVETKFLSLVLSHPSNQN